MCYYCWMNRTCTVCGESKPEDQFSWRFRGKRRAADCKACHRAWRIAYYAANSKHLEKRMVFRRVRSLKAWIVDMKARVGCATCAEKHPAALDFHHVDPEEKEISPSRLASKGWGRARIKKELDKCIVLCANCHRKLHHEHRRAVMLPVMRKGPRKPRVQLTHIEVSEIRALLVAGHNNCQIGRMFGVCHATISSIRRNKTWKLAVSTQGERARLLPENESGSIPEPPAN